MASQPTEEGQPRAARDLPNEVALLPPAPPEGLGSDSAESPLELHASGDSDLGEASPPRNWRKRANTAGHRAEIFPLNMPQTIAPVRSSPGPKGLMMGTESGGDPSDGSHLTGPQPVIPSRSSPDPRGSMRGSGGGGVPPVGTHRPGPQGANTAGHRAEIFPLNMPQTIAPVRSSPGPKGLMMGTESGGDPSDGSHLTGPQPVIPSRSSPDPRGSMRGSGGGGVPPVGTHRPGPQGANTAGHRAEIFPLNMPQTIAPVRSSPGPKGLMMGTESGGDPSDGSHLTGPQPVIPSRSSPDPRGSMRGSGGGGVPPVGTHRPGPQGANTAGHRAEIFPPNMPQTIAPGICSSRLVQAAIERPPDHNRLVARLSRLRRLTSPWAEPVETAKKKKAKKRRAANPLRSRRERIKSSSGTRPRGRPPNEAQLFAILP